VTPTFEHVQQCEGGSVVVDLPGKGRRLRTVPMPVWAKALVDDWAGGCGRAGGVASIQKGGWIVDRWNWATIERTNQGSTRMATLDQLGSFGGVLERAWEVQAPPDHQHFGYVTEAKNSSEGVVTAGGRQRDCRRSSTRSGGVKWSLRLRRRRHQSRAL